MRNLLLLSLFSGLLLSSCSEQKPTAPISIVWEMGRNGIAPGQFENFFHITNISNDTLHGNFVIYYTQMSFFGVNHDPEAALRFESLVASFQKIYPTEFWQPLAPGETFSFTARHRGGGGSLVREASAPEGVYIVMLDEYGNELAPQTIEFTVMPFNRPYQWTRVEGNRFPYADGEWMWSENAFFHEVELCVTDIIPSIKSIEKSGGTSRFTNNVHLTFDEAFENEAHLMRNRMTQLFRTRFSTGGTAVELVKIPADRQVPSREYYEITVQDGRFTLAAQTPHGVFNATQTFINILGNAGNFPAEIPNMHIADYPDFYHRGFMLDVSRNFTHKENIFRMIDYLANYKMNVFHLHLTDDEGWRIEIPGLPELTEVGARRGHTLTEHEHLVPSYSWGWNPNCPNSLANGYLTRQDFIDILQYAAARHIRVIPEIDVPGHARAAIKAMNARYRRYIDTDPARAKEFLLIDFDDTSVFRSPQHYTDNVINIAMESTYRFIDHVIGELYKMYQDAGLQMEIFHMGGDEVPRGSWTGSPVAKAFMAEHGMETIRELEDYFLERVLEMTDRRGLQLAGWEEVVVKRGQEINPRFADRNILSFVWNTIADWGGDELPYIIANAGFPVILSNASNLYFDNSYMHHQQERGNQWAGYTNEFNSFDLLPFNLYKSLHRDTHGRPIDIFAHAARRVPLLEDARRNIIGIQGQIWGETIRGFYQVEYFFFPKSFGLFERAWNAEPEWGNPYCAEKYMVARIRYANQIAQFELPRLQRMGANFRVAPPGIIVRDGMLHANTIVPQGVIRFTTDGSVPTENSPIWTAPVAVDADVIKAKTFYLGKESVTINLMR